MTIPVLPIIATFFISVILVGLIRRLALKYGIIDHPGELRKIHRTPTPLLGGTAVIVAFVCGLLLLWPNLVGGYVLPKHVIGVIIASLVIGIGGYLDDRYTLPPQRQLIFPLLAAVIIVCSGIGIEYIRNPFGEALQLNDINIELFTYNGLPYSFTLFADLFTIVWLLGMMYTTKFLDGLDGLVSGMSIIGACIIFAVSMSREVFQPETGAIALVVAAAFFGFLLWNWNPAKIFLGESGSLFAGFILGVLAIISGSKVATTLLIFGIPILDVAWVILRRLLIERRSPFQADRKHLHLRLIDSGLSQRQAVLLLYALTVLFGLSSLFSTTRTKIMLLVVVLIVMCVLGGIVLFVHRKRSKS